MRQARLSYLAGGVVRLAGRRLRNGYGVQVKPDSISLAIEDAEEDWAAPDVVIRRADNDWIRSFRRRGLSRV